MALVPGDIQADDRLGTCWVIRPAGPTISSFMREEVEDEVGDQAPGFSTWGLPFLTRPVGRSLISTSPYPAGLWRGLKACRLAVLDQNCSANDRQVTRMQQAGPTQESPSRGMAPTRWAAIPTTGGRYRAQGHH
jgi:hypothetical protein